MPRRAAHQAPRATLSAIALEAAVSISTLSKVLNQRSGVSEATRARVGAALDRARYRRTVQDTHVPLVELVFSSITSEWAVELIRGVERAGREARLGVVVTESGDRHSPGPEWISDVLARRPVGVILVFSDLPAEQKRQLRVSNIPFVIVDPAGEPAPDVPSVGSGNWYGGMLATRHLIDLGHRRIAYISGPQDMLPSRARLAGYRSAMEAAGLAVDESLIRPGTYVREDGLEQGHQLLALADRPTAIFAGADLQAVGVYQAARRRGIEIPAQLSVVGYDDLEVASWVEPGMTTVRQPLVRMAEEATRLVLRLAQHGPLEDMRIELATSLVVRGSTAPPATP